ncbi:aminopeptidase P N-terminal domain-containing protein [Chitinasiproducens palmae]|uniref:Xaa-Pro aminopeptidase n=1 Tax=Chitinasiproducens palmae TaxID=1770053 RepID=A0A1H2PPB8_9BURK|nr:aminopeptidase P N-terminal domain-containing protein [Chitinasiproducens palmae]SDV48117.1 aminopeptidase P Metallo peptidase. MEROPS family M24B [Chitinasiproducens palmae]
MTSDPTLAADAALSASDAHVYAAVPPARYAARRAALVDAMRAAGGGVAIIAAAPVVMRNRDSDYPYRQDSYFHYLCGFDEPDTLLLIDSDGTLRAPDRAAPGADGEQAALARPRATLFCRARDPQHEIWEGLRFGPDGAREAFGLDAAWPNEARDSRVLDVLAQARTVWLPFAAKATASCVNDWLARLRARREPVAPETVRDLTPLLDALRVVKDDDEIALMRGAGRISALGHRRAMQACRVGMREYELEAELLHTFRRHGAQAPAYTSIVATGANACILHYPAGNAILRDGDLVLIDAGCEIDGYAGDISRTFPANGRFSGPQRALYEIVLAAQRAAIAATRPGARFDDAHQAAVRVLAQGMLDTGLLDADRHGTLDDVIAARAYARFYMHRTGHWLGLDVHDCGDYRDPPRPEEGTTGPRASRTLQPGMVLTIEPGLYVRAADDVPAAFHDIGIRIEDDALVTADGCALLTRDVPVACDEIEALMRDGQ